MTLTSSRHLILVLVATLALAACDASEQNITWEPGNSLGIEGPFRMGTSGPIADDGARVVYLPVYPSNLSTNDVYFYVNGYDRNKTYTWTFNGRDVSANQQEGVVTVDLPASLEPGTYTVTVSNGELSGTREMTFVRPSLLVQLGRTGFPFTLLESVLDSDLEDELDEGGPFTILAPTNAAFRAAFDADGDGTIDTDEWPEEDVVANVLRQHIIPERVMAAEITDGASYTTLSGDEVTFQREGDQIRVAINGEVQASVVSPSNLEAANGVIHALDAVLLPAGDN